MAAQNETSLTEGTEAHGGESASGGLPQMDTSTYPSQLFWLVVTFAVLFLIMRKVTLPKIGAAISAREHKISGDLAEAERLRAEAQAAVTGYETSLAEARARALKLAEENQKQVGAEIGRLKADADAETARAASDADARIASVRARAQGNVRLAAGEAAAAIVERLLGESVSADEAARAVDAGAR